MAERPALSPDGRKLAWSTTECTAGGPCELKIRAQEITGGDPVVIRDLAGQTGAKGGGYLRSLRWSLDGASLLYTYDNPVDSVAGVYEIPWTGGSPTRLASGVATGVRPIPGTVRRPPTIFVLGGIEERQATTRARGGSVP